VQSLLIVAEYALALTVLIGAGLVVNTLLRLQRVDPGVERAGVLVVRLPLPDARYEEPEKAEAFYDAVMQRMREQPGVTAASISMAVPPDRLVMRNPFTPEGKTFAAGESAPLAEELVVSADYFRLLGVPVLRGRAFTGADRVDAPPVAIVNETLARRHFGTPDAVGRWLQTGDPDPESPRLTIVGVVRDVKYQGLDAEAAPTIYVPYSQNRWWRSMYLLVRASGDPSRLAPAVRTAVAAADPEVPLQEVRTLDGLMFESVAGPRFRAGLLGAFGVVALLLAGAGIYGVLSYTVNQRQRETGVRLALGARRGDIVRLIVRDGMRLALLGVALGVVLSLGLTRLLRGVLYEVSPLDPTTFGTMAAFLAVVGLAACALPARRASRVDPMVSLRGE
jgi:putative ABC transport system permease protein